MRTILAALVLCVSLLASAGCATAAPAVAPAVAPAGAPVRTRTVEYRDGDTALVGHLALPDGGGRHPVVLVIHEWWGRTGHADRSADELARLGYVALALDMYGDGRTTGDGEQAGEWAGVVRKDPELQRRRIRAALDVVRSLPEADPSRVACIGFCFGGTMSLNAAWSGEDLRAVVSFHGSLTTPTADQAKGVKASVLVCHGADDPYVPAESVAAFESSMRQNGLDWQFVSYGGAVHSFTNPEADGSFNPGAKHHPVAAARAWEAMRAFLAERLR
jgi:dienelactone hydrolase